MADTTDLLDDEMIDPVTGEIVNQKDLRSGCSRGRRNRA